MKNLVKFGIAVGLVVAPTLLANNVRMVRYGNYNAGVGGGEFTVIPLATGSPDLRNALNSYVFPKTTFFGGFQTFCLEEKMAYPFGLAQADVNKFGDALGGGPNVGAPGPDGGDPISQGTAWLYERFARGTLDYDYTAGPGPVGQGRRDDAAALQLAIWWLEDEAVSDQSANKYVVEAQTFFSGKAKDDNAPAGFGVGVLNVTVDGKPGVDYQDVLILVPDGGLTVGLLGLGMLLLGGIRRKLA